MYLAVLDLHRINADRFRRGVAVGVARLHVKSGLMEWALHEPVLKKAVGEQCVLVAADVVYGVISVADPTNGYVLAVNLETDKTVFGNSIRRNCDLPRHIEHRAGPTAILRVETPIASP